MGHSALFDGFATRLVAESARLTGTYQAFTMGAFVNLSQAPVGRGDAAILADASYGAGLTYHSDGRIYAYAGGGNQHVSSPSAVAPGGWHHVAQTYSAVTKTTKLFIDGLPVATNNALNVVGQPASIQSLRMGHLGGSTSLLNGQIDEAFLFDETLSDAAIFALAHPSAAPARMWMTTGDSQPIPALVNAGGVPEYDLVRAAGAQSPGETTTFTVWAQPARDAAGFYKQLQNLSLNIVSEDGLVDILQVDVLNPQVTLHGNPLNQVKRFSSERDSLALDANNPELNFTTLTAGEISGATPDKALNVQGKNLAAFETTAGVGVGPWPLPGDPTAMMTPEGPVWKLATVTVQALDAVGQDSLRLQIGASGINHAG